MLTITPMSYRELTDPIKQAELLDRIKAGDRIGIKFPGSWHTNIMGTVCDSCEGVVIIEPCDGGIAETYDLDSYLLADCTILIARLTDCRVA